MIEANPELLFSTATRQKYNGKKMKKCVFICLFIGLLIAWESWQLFNVNCTCTCMCVCYRLEKEYTQMKTKEQEELIEIRVGL